MQTIKQHCNDLIYNWKIRRLRHKLAASKGLIANMRRGGSTIDALTLNVAHDLETGGDGSYFYLDKTWKTDVQIRYTLDIRSLNANIESNAYFATHLARDTKTIPNKFSTKIIIKTRSPYEQIPSYAILLMQSKGIHKKDALERAIHYYCHFTESWFPLMRNCTLVKHLLYEDFKIAPVEFYKNIANHLELDISTETLEKAVALCTFEKTQEKINKDTINNPRSSFASIISQTFSRDDYINIKKQLLSCCSVDLPPHYSLEHHLSYM